MAKKKLSQRARPAQRPTPPGTPGPSGGLTGPRIALIAGGLVVAVVVTVFGLWQRRGDDTPGPLTPFPPPSAALGAADDDGGAFMGSESCAGCHRAEYDAWSGSTHAAAGGAPGTVRVIAPFDGTPIRFADATVLPERRGNEWRFIVRQAGRPERIFRVDGVIGGGHMQGGGTQGFVTRLRDGTMRFLPFDFIRKEGTWFCNTASRANRGWVPITPEVRLADCGDWPPNRVLGDEPRFTNCQSCHGSQIEVVADTVAHAYRTRYTSLGINCESCHGPGGRHLERVRDPQAVAAGDIGMRPLATLSKDGSLGTCWPCHALKDRLRAGYRSGQPLEAAYSIHLPQLGDAAHHPDGRVRTFAYQQGHLYSDCYVNGGMTCTSCHDPHSQGYRDVQGRALEGRFDDRQCTSCHPSKAQQSEAHTRHAPGSAGSRCVACHMPYLQEPEVGSGLRYGRSDHAIPIPRPSADSALGVVSACRGCHTDRSESVLDAQVREWYGELKPVAPAIASVLRGRDERDAGRAASLLLLPDAPQTATVYAGLAAFAERHLAADMAALDATTVERLQGLARHRDQDVRSLALASLHLARGNVRRVRAFLAERLGAQGADEPLVRSRWAVALGFFGDKLRLAGDPVTAATVYRKALEVEPRNAQVHLNLGLAQAAAGRQPEAIASFRESLAIEPLQPLAEVNLGIALAATGDRAGAERAYQRALAINAREPLAHFNLANLYVLSDQFDRAAASYAAAAEADPSLSLAHFSLARLLVQRGDLRGALEHVEAGLEFDAGNAEWRAAREQIRQRLAASR